MLIYLAPSAVFCHEIYTHFIIIENSIDFVHQFKIKLNNYKSFAACFLVLLTPNKKRVPLVVCFYFYMKYASVIIIFVAVIDTLKFPFTSSSVFCHVINARFLIIFLIFFTN